MPVARSETGTHEVLSSGNHGVCSDAGGLLEGLPDSHCVRNASQARQPRWLMLKCAPPAHRHVATGRAHSHGLRALSGKDVLGSRHTSHWLCELGQGTTRCVASAASVLTLPGSPQLHRCSGEGAHVFSLSHCIAPASCNIQLTGTMMLSAIHFTFLQAGAAMPDAREATIPHAQQARME